MEKKKKQRDSKDESTVEEQKSKLSMSACAT